MVFYVAMLITEICYFVVTLNDFPFNVCFSMS